MKLLTRNDFLGLTDKDQAKYLNDLADFLGIDKTTYEKDDLIFDRDSGTVIDNLFDYALDLNYNPTDFEGKVFADD